MIGAVNNDVDDDDDDDDNDNNNDKLVMFIFTSLTKISHDVPWVFHGTSCVLNGLPCDTINLAKCTMEHHGFYQLGRRNTIEICNTLLNRFCNISDLLAWWCLEQHYVDVLL